MLSATEPWADEGIYLVVPWQHVLRFMHEELFQHAANLAAIVMGLWVGMGHIRRPHRRAWVVVAAGTMVGVLCVGILVWAVGDMAAAFVAGAAIMWLVVAPRRVR